MLRIFSLSENERIAVRNLLVKLGTDPKNLDENLFLERAALVAHELPPRIRETLYEFKLGEKHPGLLITNNPVFEQNVGPTPQTH
jgi:hypothetical protein